MERKELILKEKLIFKKNREKVTVFWAFFIEKNRIKYFINNW